MSCTQSRFIRRATCWHHAKRLKGSAACNEVFNTTMLPIDISDAKVGCLNPALSTASTTFCTQAQPCFLQLDETMFTHHTLLLFATRAIHDRVTRWRTLTGGRRCHGTPSKARAGLPARSASHTLSQLKPTALTIKCFPILCSTQHAMPTPTSRAAPLVAHRPRRAVPQVAKQFMIAFVSEEEQEPLPPPPTGTVSPPHRPSSSPACAAVPVLPRHTPMPSRERVTL